MEAFFGVPLNLRQTPPFLGAIEGKDAAKLMAEWSSCLQLRDNGVKEFTFSNTGSQGPQHFLFTVGRPASTVAIHPPPLIVSATRIDSNIVSKEETNRLLFENKYAEFIELAAHDLDSPLRKLSVLLERIAGKYQNKTQQDTQGYFLRAGACISDLRTLIENLVLLARLNNNVKKIAPCDLESIVRSVTKDLDGMPGEKNISIRSGSLPVIEGDILQYRQLFRSLVENAFKFSKKEIPADVVIFSEEASEKEKQLHSLHKGNSYFKITISDNGIGFRQEHAEKIFEPLVRLNGKSEYPGSGIGLAISKQIVENHGGVIYAEGDENIGARFILFLPLSPY